VLLFIYRNLKEFKSVAVVADLQVSGKGRGANTWTSPLGCLMVDLLFQARLLFDFLFAILLSS